MFQFEENSRNIVSSKESWSQFQSEARASNISTTAGVKEMLKQKQPQRSESHSRSIDHSSVKARGSVTLLSAMTRNRSEVSWGSRSSSGVTGRQDRNNEIFELVQPPRRLSQFSRSINDDRSESESFLPFIPPRLHDIKDYGQVIRGNNQSVLSLYGTQGKKTSSNPFPHALFRSLMQGLEPKQVEQQQKCGADHAADSAGGVSPIKAMSNLSLKLVLQPNRFSESEVYRRKRSSCDVKNELFDFTPLSPPFFHKLEVDQCNIMSNSKSANKPSNIFRRNPRSQNTLSLQKPNKSAPVKVFNEEIDAYFVSSDEDDSDDIDDDKSNNGCFEYPRCSRQIALDRSMRSDTLLVEWDDAVGLNSACYPYYLGSGKKSVEKSMESSFTSSTSVGSSLLVEWGDTSSLSFDSD